MNLEEFKKEQIKKIREFILLKLNPQTPVLKLNLRYNNLMACLKANIFAIFTNQWLDNEISDEFYSTHINECETDEFCERYLQSDIDFITRTLKNLGEIE